MLFLQKSQKYHEVIENANLKKKKMKSSVSIIEIILNCKKMHLHTNSNAKMCNLKH